MKKFLVNNWKTVLLSAFLICFTTLSLLSIFRQSLTFDEIVYLQEGREVILHHTFSIDPYNPPLVKELSVLPYLPIKQFYTDPMFILHYQYFAKFVMIIFGLGLLLLTYFLTKNLFGESEALFAVFLLSLEPTVLANSNLVTLDMGITFFFLLSFSLFIQIIEYSTLKQKIFLAVSIGLGVATKLSFIPFFLTSAIGISVYTYQGNVLQKVWKNKIQIAAIIFTSMIVVWIAYLFAISPIIKQRNDATRASQRVLTFASKHHLLFVSQIINFGQNQAVPLGDFIAINKNTLLRKPVANCFFLGSYFNGCSWYFLPINLFLKLPLPIIILFVVSLFLFIQHKNYRKAKMLIIIPLICLLLISSVSRMQPLVRYILPAYPFLMIFSASGWKYWQKNVVTKLLLSILCFWYVVSTIITFPHFLSFANETAGYSHNRFRFLTDSNLDWGQSLRDVSEFIRNEKSKTITFSYFGRDNGDWYGLKSDKEYMSYKAPEICQFHTIGENKSKDSIILISSSNWYSCGYYREKKFAKNKIKDILGNTILVF